MAKLVFLTVKKIQLLGCASQIEKEIASKRNQFVESTTAGPKR